MSEEFFKVKVENDFFIQCDICKHFRSWRKGRFSCAIFDYFRYLKHPCPKFILNHDEAEYVKAIRQWLQLPKQERKKTSMPFRTEENIKLQNSLTIEK